MAKCMVKREKQNLASKLPFLGEEEEKEKKYSLRAPSNRYYQGSKALWKVQTNEK